MIPLIQQAMVMGYGAEKILSFLGNKIPGMQSGLANAKSSGYSDDDILNFLKNKIPQKDPKGSQKYSNQLDTYLSSNGITTKEERSETRNKGIKTALGVAGTAMGAYKAFENYSGIADQIKDYFMGDKEGTKQPEDETKPKSLFERLLGGVNPSTLDEGTQKQLGFLAPIAEQFEKKGKDENDPSVQKLKRKIQNILKGKQGFLEKQAMELDPLEQVAERIAPMVAQPEQAQLAQPIQTQQGGGPGEQALMAILQQIQATRGFGG